MATDFLIGGIAAGLLAVYLVVSILYPEKF
jgi:K+-transporting ATPase KdpF subunit